MSHSSFQKINLTSTKPLVMGILNVTPDSFSDGGSFIEPEKACEKVELMISQGVDIVDIGGESTRPGAKTVTVQQEIDRIIPLLQALKGMDCAISVDTRKTQVMQLAIAEGVSMINDVTALESPGALELLASANLPVCLMHMKGMPETMQDHAAYENVTDEVLSYLLARAKQAELAGIRRENIILDPGFGFGKKIHHNVQLFKELPKIISKDYPVLCGVSRKSMLGEITGKAVAERMVASVTAAILAVQSGVKILRVHDVAETVDALKILQTLNG
ncbi:MAG: dihydropteroate synthase [Gammaproteobacteria bacterium CG22_combo_CG10-13_8_21_14_all_40_8]|nr:MAG: dihydropteroate synthase [Gammaproteobacteria bacterium CG22_combo_CG10-13_8_21_14_all_40_8]